MAHFKIAKGQSCSSRSLIRGQKTNLEVHTSDNILGLGSFVKLEEWVWFWSYDQQENVMCLHYNYFHIYFQEVVSSIIISTPPPPHNAVSTIPLMYMWPGVIFSFNTTLHIVWWSDEKSRCTILFLKQLWLYNSVSVEIMVSYHLYSLDYQ